MRCGQVDDGSDYGVRLSVRHGDLRCYGCTHTRAPLDRLVLLAVGPEPASLREVCERVGRTAKDGAVRRVLRDLTRDGSLTRSSDGLFAGPFDPGLDLPDLTRPHRVADASPARSARPLDAAAGGVL